MDAVRVPLLTHPHRLRFRVARATSVEDERLFEAPRRSLRVILVYEPRRSFGRLKDVALAIGSAPRWS